MKLASFFQHVGNQIINLFGLHCVVGPNTGGLLALESCDSAVVIRANGNADMVISQDETPGAETGRVNVMMFSTS